MSKAMRERVPLMAFNWKMNTTVTEGVTLVRTLRKQTLPRDIDVVILPPFPHLAVLREELAGSEIALGAQDVFWERSGPYTGEVSALAIGELCIWCLVGHSERRAMRGETDDLIARKLRCALDIGLHVIIAVGETVEQRDARMTNDVVRDQVLTITDGLDLPALRRCAIAYEPVWAISTSGSGRQATPEQAQEVCQFVRQLIGNAFSQPTASAIRILYGGSLVSSNAGSFFSCPDVDGGLVGGASLRPDDCTKIVQAYGQLIA